MIHRRAFTASLPTILSRHRDGSVITAWIVPRDKPRLDDEDDDLE